METLNMKHNNIPKIYGLYDPRHPNDIKYVGVTIQDLSTRLIEHRCITNIDNGRKLTYKENWIQKLKQEGIQPIIKLIEICETEELMYKHEIEWIKNFRKQGYKLTNIDDGGKGGRSGPRGPMPEAIKRKISDALKGKPGKPLSEETKRKMSEATRGIPRKPLSEETKKKISTSRKGKLGNHQLSHSKETKRKISESLKGREGLTKGVPKTEGHKKKLSEAHNGKILSEETKRKISEGLNKRYANMPYSRNN